MGLMFHTKLNNLLGKGDIDDTAYAALYQGCRNFYFQYAKYSQATMSCSFMPDL